MKQIKVYITAEQWAEKRLQLINNSYTAQQGFEIENIDHYIKLCGFELIESETKPDENNNNPTYGGIALLSENNDIPTDKVEAVKYFLNQLPDGYKERALAQVDDVRVNSRNIVQDIASSIDCFNIWEKTKEGAKFWERVFNHYFKSPYYPTLPPLPND